MEKDRFDLKMIDIEQKSFELGMLMSVFVFEILETFENSSADIAAYINIYAQDGNSLPLEMEKITLNRETGEIILNCAEGKPVLWDDLDLVAKEIVMNELHHRYKADRLYRGLSDNGGVH